MNKGTAIERVVKKGGVRKLLAGYAYKLAKSPLIAWPGECDVRELAEDVVSEAVCKTITGERAWEPIEPFSISGLLSEADEQALIEHLLGAIKSITNNRNRNAENKLKKCAEDTPNASLQASPLPSALDELQADEFFYGLLIEMEDDEICSKMVDLYEKGWKPAEVAEQLGLATTELYAANKRLKRKARAYLEKLRAEAENHA